MSNSGLNREAYLNFLTGISKLERMVKTSTRQHREVLRGYHTVLFRQHKRLGLPNHGSEFKVLLSLKKRLNNSYWAQPTKQGNQDESERLKKAF